MHAKVMVRLQIAWSDEMHANSPYFGSSGNFLGKELLIHPWPSQKGNIWPHPSSPAISLDLRLLENTSFFPCRHIMTYPCQIIHRPSNPSVLGFDRRSSWTFCWPSDPDVQRAAWESWRPGRRISWANNVTWCIGFFLDLMIFTIYKWHSHVFDAWIPINLLNDVFYEGDVIWVERFSGFVPGKIWNIYIMYLFAAFAPCSSRSIHFDTFFGVAYHSTPSIAKGKRVSKHWVDDFLRR